MGMVVNTNVQALNANRNLGIVSDKSSKASEKLSSGLRINRAADDAAGLAISEKMRSQIRGLDQASANAQDGISLLQTAEGALQETEDILQRMRELVVNASNDTMTDDDREKVALELNELSKEIDGIAEKTEYNTKKLIDGSQSSKGIYLQTGANATQGMNFNISSMNSSYLGVTEKDIGGIVTLDSSKLESQSLVAGSTTAYNMNLNGVSLKQTGTYHFDGGDLTINQDGSIEISGSFSIVDVGGTDTAKTLTNGTFNSYEDLLSAYYPELSADQVAAGVSLTLYDENGSSVAIDTKSGDVTFALNDTSTATVLAAIEFKDDGTTLSGATQSWTLGDAKVTFTAVDTNNSGNFSLAAGDYIGVKFTNADDLIITGDSVTDSLINKIKAGEEIDIKALNGVEITYQETDGTYSKATVAIDSTGLKATTTDEEVLAKSALTKGEVISSLTNTLDKAIGEVSSQRAKLGAYQNRLEHTIKNVDTSSENLTAAESRIRDTDMADEMMNYTQGNVLTQAATSMLAQANQSTQNALSLLG